MGFRRRYCTSPPCRSPSARFREQFGRRASTGLQKPREKTDRFRDMNNSESIELRRAGYRDWRAARLWRSRRREQKGTRWECNDGIAIFVGIEAKNTLPWVQTPPRGRDPLGARLGAGSTSGPHRDGSGNIDAGEPNHARAEHSRKYSVRLAGFTGPLVLKGGLDTQTRRFLVVLERMRGRERRKKLSIASLSPMRPAR